MAPTRRRFLAAASLTALAGCSGSSDGGADGSGGGTAAGTEGTAATGSIATVPTASQRLPLPRTPAALREAARSGGPSKDGIPSIDDPQFVPADGADFLDPGDPVFGLARDGTAKAYPQKVLVHHEICNDTVAGTPLSVTYCPLTGTVQGFERGDTTFGVSGRLINNNLVMYDRATEAWWPQILATSIPGPWNADPEIRSLREVRLVWTTWAQWRDQHPDTAVLSTATGHARNYGRDPYGDYNPRVGYYDNDRLIFEALGEDERYHVKTVVMGARTPEGAVAFLKESILDQGVMRGAIGDTPVVAVADDRYDTAYVYRNPDEATLEREDNRGVGPDGAAHAPDDLPLARIHTFDAMWFAWAGYYPETAVYE